MKMKHLAVAALAAGSLSAVADYRLIIPQNPGEGTSVWGSIVAKELEKKLGEKIVLEHIPGANDIPGFNKFHNDLQKDPKVIMLAHGGNAESFLIHKVDYDYKKYDPIGLQNLTIVVGVRADTDLKKKLKFGYASGTNPDALSITMMLCGPGKTIPEYAACFKDRVVYVPGMKGNERRLAFIRGELNVTRETPAAYLKYYKTADYKLWFNSGILDIKTGKLVADKNFPGVTFNEVFKKTWGVEPSGDFYNMYLLSRNYRDVFQKSLWVSKNNPNTAKLREALLAMTKDKDSMAIIEKETGEYPWLIGKDVDTAMNTLTKLTTKKALKDLVQWTATSFNQEAFYKEEIAHTAK